MCCRSRFSNLPIDSQYPTGDKTVNLAMDHQSPSRVVPLYSDRDVDGRATRVNLFDFHSAPMRAFHLSWFAFFLCFVAWFGIAPLMKVVRDEMHLSKGQVGWCIIGSVAITVLARLVVGLLCDRIGPRLAFAGLLLL